MPGVLSSFLIFLMYRFFLLYLFFFYSLFVRHRVSFNYRVSGLDIVWLYCTLLYEVFVYTCHVYFCSCCSVCCCTAVAAAAATCCCYLLLFVILCRMAKFVAAVNCIWLQCFLYLYHTCKHYVLNVRLGSNGAFTASISLSIIHTMHSRLITGMRGANPLL